MSTASDEQVAVIRRGWMGTAASVVPEVSGLTAFMEDRLVDLESRGELTENDLLAVVEAASQMVLASGDADQARDTSRRMRRTVYEFLLALDASSTEETGDDHRSREPSPVSSHSELHEVGTMAEGSPKGAEAPVVDNEPLRLPATTLTVGDAADSPGADEDGGPDDHEAAPAWETVGRRRPAPVQGDQDPGFEDTDQATVAPAIVAPRAGFHLTDPVEDLPEADEPELDKPEPDGPAGFGPLEPAAPFSPLEATAPLIPFEYPSGSANGSGDPHGRPQGDGDPHADQPGEPLGEREAAGQVPSPQFVALPTPDGAGKDGDVGGRNGATDGPSEPSAHAAAQPEHFEELVTPRTPPVRPPALQTPAAWTAMITEVAQPAGGREEPALVPDLWGDDLSVDNFGTGDAPDGDPGFDDAAASADGPRDGGRVPAWRTPPPDQEAHGPTAASSWRVRKPELAGEGGRRGSSGDLPADSWQSADDDPEPPPDLSAPRREIDGLLQRKKFDQTGAVLQQLAQDPGGRAVAELALDIGDRCRAMGKRMAATSCYLAASRADPVFEEPLSRLADVCIDDRDIDLAVSYLERIARLTRAGGDVKGALRVYRKIHAIAPYRDDILDLLMRAQTTGRLDP